MGRHEVTIRCYPLCIPRPAAGGIAGGGRDLRKIALPAGPYGGKGENEAFSLVAPPCDPVPTSPSVPKAKLLSEHEDAGRTGRRHPLFLPASGFPRFPVRCGINRHLSVFSSSFRYVPLVPSGRGKGASYGGVAPLRGPFPPPPNHPPYLALRLCVHCPPVPTKASLSEQAGAHIHPRMRGGMKSGQGSSPFVCTPARRRRDCRGRARPENPQTFGRAVRREGWKHDVGLGRAPRLPRPEGAE